jgi:hypothetical protein
MARKRKTVAPHEEEVQAKVPKMTSNDQGTPGFHKLPLELKRFVSDYLQYPSIETTFKS